jgi:hypothetical protein
MNRRELFKSAAAAAGGAGFPRFQHGELTQKAEHQAPSAQSLMRLIETHDQSLGRCASLSSFEKITAVPIGLQYGSAFSLHKGFVNVKHSFDHLAG